MAKKRVAAIVKIQIPAGKATPAPPVGTALGPHGIAIMDFVKAYNAATEAQVGTVVPVEITVFEDRSFTFVLKTPPTPVLIREEGRRRQGVEHAWQGTCRHASPRPTSRRSPRSRCPTSTPTTSKLPSSRSAAPPARWASQSRKQSTTRPTIRPGTTSPGGSRSTTEGDRTCPARSSPTRSKQFDRDRYYTPTEALELVKKMAERQVRRERRHRLPPRRRPAQGRPDGARHRRPAVGHRQGRPRRRVRHR